MTLAEFTLSGSAMQITPIDLTELVATILGISIILIPVIGITARFALKPTVEAMSRFFDHKGLGENVQILERRMALQEQGQPTATGSAEEQA